MEEKGARERLEKIRNVSINVALDILSNAHTFRGKCCFDT
jgi:hypothetical protein